MKPAANHGNGIYSDFDRNFSVSEKDFYMQNNSRDEDNGNGSGNDLTKNKYYNGNNVNVGINVDIKNSVNANHNRISNVIVSSKYANSKNAYKKKEDFVMVNGKNENNGFVNRNGLDRHQEIALQNTINQNSKFRDSQNAAENGKNSEIGENSIILLI